MPAVASCACGSKTMARRSEQFRPNTLHFHDLSPPHPHPHSPTQKQTDLWVETSPFGARGCVSRLTDSCFLCEPLRLAGSFPFNTLKAMG